MKEVDSEAKRQDVVRRLGVTEQTYYRWKAEYGGMEVSDAKKLRALEDEIRRLKQMVRPQSSLGDQTPKRIGRRMIFQYLSRSSMLVGH